MADKIFNINVDILGELSLPNTSNQSGNFLTLNGLNQVKKRTANEVLVDIGVSGNYQLLSQKGQSNGYVPLDNSGLIPQSYLPPVTITETFVVTSQTAMLALVAQTGDVAVRTDENKSYILQGTDPTILGDWQELLSPTDVVQSVNGLTGTITLDLIFNSGLLSMAGGNSVNLDNRYYTETEVDNLLTGYSQIGHVHTISDITDFPTNVSHFTNDVGYLTSFTESDPIFTAHTVSNIINGAGFLKNDGIGNWSYDDNTYLTTISGLSHTLLSNVGVNTHTQIDNHIANSSIHFTMGSISITESQISDLQTYLTSETNDLTQSVVWTNVPDINITQSSVVQHQSALSITESQISDLNHFTPSTLLIDYGFTDNSTNWNTAYSWGDHSGLYSLLGHTHTFDSLTSKPTTIAGYGITDVYTKIESESRYVNVTGDTMTGTGFMQLGVKGNTGSQAGGIYIYNNIDYALSLEVTGSTQADNPNSSVFYTRNGLNKIQFGSSRANPQLTLKTNTGNLLVGTTTDDGVNKLQVEGNAKATSFIGNGSQLTNVDAVTLNGRSDYFNKDYLKGLHINSADADTYFSGETGGFIGSYNNSSWLLNGAFTGYGGLMEFDASFNSSTQNKLQLQFNNGNGTTDGGRLAFRTKNNTNYTTWKELWHSGNFGKTEIDALGINATELGGQPASNYDFRNFGLGVENIPVKSLVDGVIPLGESGFYASGVSNSILSAPRYITISRGSSAFGLLFSSSTRRASLQFYDNTQEELYHSGNFTPSDYLNKTTGGTITGNTIIDPLGSTTNIAGSLLTIKKESDASGTNVAQFNEVTRTGTEVATGNTYATVNRVTNSSTVNVEGIIGTNNVGTYNGSGGGNFVYGAITSATHEGSGNLNFLIPNSDRSTFQGTGTGTIDYIRGHSVTSKIDNPNGTVNWLQGSHISANVQNGTVTNEVNSLYLDIDINNANSPTISGDITYLRGGSGSDVINAVVTGKKRFIWNESPFESDFNGIINVLNPVTDLESATEKVVLNKEYGDKHYIKKTDFYDEGTFTPTLTDSTGGATYTIGNVTAKYTRQGNTVFFSIFLDNITTTGTPTGILQIQNMPFFIDGVSSFSLSQFSGSDVNYYSAIARRNGSTDINFHFQQTLDNNYASFTGITITNGDIEISGTYKTNVYTP